MERTDKPLISICFFLSSVDVFDDETIVKEIHVSIRSSFSFLIALKCICYQILRMDLFERLARYPHWAVRFSALSALEVSNL